MIRVAFWSLYSALVSATCVHAWMTCRLMNTQNQLVNARGDAAYANEVADQLLSGGRFIRTYDPKLGKDIYKFKPPARQMTRLMMNEVSTDESFFETVMEWIVEALNDFEITDEAGQKIAVTS